MILFYNRFHISSSLTVSIVIYQMNLFILVFVYFQNNIYINTVKIKLNHLERMEKLVHKITHTTVGDRRNEKILI